MFRVDQVWTGIGLPTHRNKFATPEDFVSRNLELETVSQISAMGPSGGSLLSRVMDLTNLARNKSRFYTLYIMRNIIGFTLTEEWKLDLEETFSSKGFKPLQGTNSVFANLYLFRDIYPEFDKLRIGSHLQKSYINRVLNRLAIFPDGLGRLRYVAISDFPTQSVLKRLHKLIFRLLRITKSDATFDQGKIYDWYRRNMDKPIFSLDLSSATDRLPLPLQAKLLGKIFGSNLLALF